MASTVEMLFITLVIMKGNGGGGSGTLCINPSVHASATMNYRWIYNAMHEVGNTECSGNKKMAIRHSAN